MYTANDAIDIWIVERALGQGGMGSVYRCHNRDAKRILAAIKVLDYGLKRSTKARARFVREAEILFALDHPNIVKVRNVRLDAAPPYLEMEFVEGGSLEHRLGEGAVDAQTVVLWLSQLASALAYLHGRGIRHRDIKPSNILVGRHGNATLVDFGIATEAEGNTLSEGGQAMGSVAYVPPEWVRAGELDPVQWDIYALGVCAYEALTGKTAFEVPTGGMSTQVFFQVLTAKQGHAPLDPGPSVPYALRTLVRDMTWASPAERIAHADEVVERIAAIDLEDIRENVSVCDEARATPSDRRDANTPAGLTMVPGRAGATTPPGAFAEGGAESTGAWARQPSAGPPPPTSPPSARPAPVSAAPGLSRTRLLLALGFGLVLGAVLLVGGVWWVESQPPPALSAVTVVVPAKPEVAPPLAANTPVLPTLVPPPASPAPALPVAAVPSAPTPAAPKAPVVATPAVAPASPDLVIAVPALPTAGPAITNTQLARWLEAHPDWQKDAAIAAGTADDKYLRGWERGAPPVGKESAPAVAVSWNLAKAYCAGHGGLAAMDAPPISWSEAANQPWMEYRQDHGKPMWRRDDGVVSDQVSPSQSGVFIGFRCAK